MRTSLSLLRGFPLVSQLLSFPHLAVSRTLRDLAIMANKLKAMAAAAAAAAVAPTGAFVLFFSPQCFLWDCASPTFNLGIRAGLHERQRGFAGVRTRSYD